MAILADNDANLLKGTAFGNLIAGLGGNDTVFGFAGRDTLSGGSGNDLIAGGEGRDTLSGNFGDDIIYGFGRTDSQSGTSNIVIDQVGSTLFDRPVFACSAPGDADRLFVVEQHTGKILILDTVTGEARSTPFLDIPDSQLAQGDEQGLLGLAFDPAYQSNGKFYVYLTNASDDIEIRSYTRSAGNPNQADAASGNLILIIDKDNGAGNHNGGWMGFGPDKMLYVGVGDEGLGGDPNNNAQNKDVLWGKMLRIDVNHDDFSADPDRDYAIPDDNPFANTDGADEIWALGLRNPWRSSFDRLTGDLYIGDVGQGAHEEIDFQKAGFTGGANYGWKIKEGHFVYDDSVPGNLPANSPILTDPVLDYPHDETGGDAITGGYVYRGTTGGMQGRYIYADFVSGKLWSFRVVNGKAIDVKEHSAQLDIHSGGVASISSFAEDGHGNLYAISLSGTISKLTFGTGAGDGADWLSGGAGNDKLYGGAGDDHLLGDSGKDSIFGGIENDAIYGGSGNDRLNGGSGDDTLSGDTGNDTLTGGSGQDRFYFSTGGGKDTIVDFQDNMDEIRLSDDFGFTNVSQALADAVRSGDNVVFTFDDGETLTILHTTKAALSNDLLV